MTSPSQCTKGATQRDRRIFGHKIADPARSTRKETDRSGAEIADQHVGRREIEDSAGARVGSLTAQLHEQVIAADQRVGIDGLRRGGVSQAPIEQRVNRQLRLNPPIDHQAGGVMQGAGGR